jgi:UDP-2,3-diacylglucosamine pyrophosphatase LpxH
MRPIYGGKREKDRADHSAMAERQRVRALFISDVHLGATGSQADACLDFIRGIDAGTLYLVGDIIDGWRLRKSWHWPDSHNDAIHEILARARAGVRVVYLPGNHDEFMRDFLGHEFGGIEIRDELIHQTATGEKFLVIHGDRFDAVVVHARWLALLGDWAYRAAMIVSKGISFVRRKLGLPYWSLSAWAKSKVKNAVNYAGNFEQQLTDEARRTGTNGVICGHIHTAALTNVNGITYVNTGDWVESLTAVVEHDDGRLELIRYRDAWTAKQFRAGKGGKLSPAAAA